MLLDTMFISAMGAWVTRRAQRNAEIFSGNSERNGATHCTSTNWLTPTTPATASIDSRKGWAVTYSSAPPTVNRPMIAAGRRQPGWRYAHRDTAGAEPSSSTSCGGVLNSTQRYATYIASSTTASTQPKLRLARMTKKYSSGGMRPTTSTACSLSSLIAGSRSRALLRPEYANTK